MHKTLFSLAYRTMRLLAHIRMYFLCNVTVVGDVAVALNRITNK